MDLQSSVRFIGQQSLEYRCQRFLTSKVAHTVSPVIYLAKALLFYVGAVLIARGLYTYLQMVEVLNLVVFSVTIGSQLMAF